MTGLLDKALLLLLTTRARTLPDVATIAEVLGYEQVNLYGASYGTRLGLTVMRDYPERIRSSILNAVLPFNIDLAREDAANMEHSLYTIFQACAESVFCRWAYPDLEAVFFQVYADLNTNPLQVVIEADDGRLFDFELDGETLMATMFYMLYTPRTISAIPSIIYGLHERDASQYVDFVSIPQPGDPDASGSEIMNLSVMCNDFAPFMNRAETNLAVQEPFRNMGIFNSPRFDLCPDWQTTLPDPIGADPVHSDIPTLILTGLMDHVTPASWGERTASTLENAYVYNFPHQSHGVIGSCADSILTAFVDDPMSPPPSDCIVQERPVQFLISAAGTRPWAGYSLILIGSVALGLSGYTFVNAWKRRHFPWLHSFRAMGWLTPALTALTLILLLLLPETDVTNLDAFKKARLVETIIPLALAIQAAFVLPPEDEPALELLMAYPRSLSWLVLERLAVIWAMQGIIALIGTLATIAILGDSADGIALVRWIPPAMLLSGLSLNAALRSRKAVFGVLVAGLVWFVMALLGKAFLPGQPTTYPLNYIQPLVWPLHAYLQPGDLLLRDYWLNRAFVFVAGLNLVMLAVAFVRDHERLLLGKPAVTVKPERMVAS